MHHSSQTEESQALKRKGLRGLAERYAQCNPIFFLWPSSHGTTRVDQMSEGPDSWPLETLLGAFCHERRKEDFICSSMLKQGKWKDSPHPSWLPTPTPWLIPWGLPVHCSPDHEVGSWPGTSATLPLSNLCASKMGSAFRLWFLPARNAYQDPLPQNRSCARFIWDSCFVWVSSIPPRAALCSFYVNLDSIFFAEAGPILFWFHERTGKRSDHRKEKHCHSRQSPPAIMVVPLHIRLSTLLWLWPFKVLPPCFGEAEWKSWRESFCPTGG